MLLAGAPYSYAEISATLQIPVGSIGPQRARCLERLRTSYASIAGARRSQAPHPGTRGRCMRIRR